MADFFHNWDCVFSPPKSSGDNGWRSADNGSDGHTGSIRRWGWWAYWHSSELSYRGRASLRGSHLGHCQYLYQEILSQAETYIECWGWFGSSALHIASQHGQKVEWANQWFRGWHRGWNIHPDNKGHFAILKENHKIYKYLVNVLRFAGEIWSWQLTSCRAIVYLFLGLLSILTAGSFKVADLWQRIMLQRTALRTRSKRKEPVDILYLYKQEQLILPQKIYRYSPFNSALSMPYHNLTYQYILFRSLA